MTPHGDLEVCSPEQVMAHGQCRTGCHLAAMGSEGVGGGAGMAVTAPKPGPVHAHLFAAPVDGEPRAGPTQLLCLVCAVTTCSPEDV